ncbi:hypothetical protein MIZ03_0655 [Rhodoferax lithotrophicus]|uniref:Uncharacterized protein n=1 Tax=Rhodoferax lithotrophicus TaxID=2798804 RepID=A0ABM7MHY4_9BURK|nr:hypothetical protein MIZ03_0655 [Rhodoferax sp. MIZ03]
MESESKLLRGKDVYDFKSWCCQFGTPGARINARSMFTTIFGQNINTATGGFCSDVCNGSAAFNSSSSTKLLYCRFEATFYLSK